MHKPYVATWLYWQPFNKLSFFKTALRGTCGLRPSESTEDIWNEDKYIPETYLPTPGISWIWHFNFRKLGHSYIWNDIISLKKWISFFGVDLLKFLSINRSPEYFVSITAVQPSAHLDLESHLVIFFGCFFFCWNNNKLLTLFIYRCITGKPRFQTILNVNNKTANSLS